MKIVNNKTLFILLIMFCLSFISVNATESINSSFILPYYPDKNVNSFDGYCNLSNLIESSSYSVNFNWTVNEILNSSGTKSLNFFNYVASIASPNVKQLSSSNYPFLYIADENYLAVLFFNETSQTISFLTNVTGQVYHVWSNKNFVYAGFIDGSLRVYDFNGSTLNFVHSINLSMYSSINAVFGFNSTIFLASSKGLSAYNFNGTYLTEKGFINDTINQTYYDVWSNGTIVYTANYIEGIFAYYFNGSNFSKIDTFVSDGAAWKIWSNDTYVFSLNRETAVILHAYSFDGSFHYLNNYSIGGGYGYDVFDYNKYIILSFFVGVNAGLYVFNFNGLNFSQLNKLAIVTEGLWADEKYLYSVSDSDNGVSIFNFTPAHNDSIYFINEINQTFIDWTNITFSCQLCGSFGCSSYLNSSKTTIEGIYLNFSSNLFVVDKQTQNYYLSLQKYTLNTSIWSGNANLTLQMLNLTLNGSIFSSTHTNNLSKIIFKVSYTIPDFSSNIFTNLSWNYTLYNFDNNVSETKNQTIYDLKVDNCSTNIPFEILNFSYFDEKTNNFLSINNVFDVRLYDGYNYFSINYTEFGVSSSKICSTLPPTNLSYNWAFVGNSLTLSATDYVTRIFTLYSGLGVVSNNPALNLSFYLINLTSSSTVTFHWITTEFQNIDGTLLIYKCVGVNKVLVDSVPIISGLAITNLELLLQAYSYEIIYNGLVYSDTNSYSKCHLEANTDITYYVNIGGTQAMQTIGLNDINCSITKIDNQTVEMNWTANPELAGYVSGCLIAYRQSVSGNVEVYNNCSVETDGYTRRAIIPNSGYTYTVIGKLKQGDNIRTCGEQVVFFNSENSAALFGIVGVLGAIFLIISLILLYAGDGETQIVMGGVGLIVSWIIGIILMPLWVVSSILIFLLIIVLVGRYNK